MSRGVQIAQNLKPLPQSGIRQINNCDILLVLVFERQPYGQTQIGIVHADRQLTANGRHPSRRSSASTQSKGRDLLEFLQGNVVWPVHREPRFQTSDKSGHQQSQHPEIEPNRR